MLQRYEWIVDERKYFGQPNTAYDFAANDPKDAGKRIQKLQETKDKLSKSVNMRAMNMLGKAEEQVGKNNKTSNYVNFYDTNFCNCKVLNKFVPFRLEQDTECMNLLKPFFTSISKTPELQSLINRDI